MKRISVVIPGVFLLAVLGTAAAYLFWPPQLAEQGRPGGAAATAVRPAKWAVPLELPGCPNLHRLSDDLYRGAQPTVEGMKQLKRLGIKTIVNLRSAHSDRDEMGDLEFNYEHIRMNAWHAEDDELVRFLKVVADKQNAPVFVHCKHGADRTGTVCAVYRIALEGWSKEEAIKEMRDGGYGFHSVWQNLLRYVNKLDLDEIKRRAGLSD